MADDRLISPEWQEQEDYPEGSLRPLYLDDYIGQDKVKENIRVFISAARERNESLDHVLLSGPPGLGKTTLASIVANEIGKPIRKTSGPAIERPGDPALAICYPNLEPGKYCLLMSIHRLTHAVEE